MRRLLAVERDNIVVAKAAERWTRAAQRGDRATARSIGSAGGRRRVSGVYSGLADQLRRVATLIAGRNQLGVRRHLFFTAMGGYDTHASQRGELWSRYDELGPALAAFQRALDALASRAR